MFYNIGGKRKPAQGNYIPYVTAPYRSTGGIFPTSDGPAPNAYKNDVLHDKKGVIISRAKRVSPFAINSKVKAPGPL